jgi:hypothetical protein
MAIYYGGGREAAGVQTTFAGKRQHLLNNLSCKEVTNSYRDTHCKYEIKYLI